jgi:phosphatidate cytidylyltransferase
MLAQRVFTAIGIVAVLALVLFVLPPAFAVSGLALIVLAGAWEWGQFAGLDRPVARITYLAACAVAMAGLWSATAGTDA